MTGGMIQQACEAMSQAVDQLHYECRCGNRRWIRTPNPGRLPYVTCECGKRMRNIGRAKAALVVAESAGGVTKISITGLSIESSGR